MKLIYLAGPYRGDMAIDLIKLDLDCFPVTPHLNTAFFERDLPDVDDEIWLTGTLELMKKCDAVLLISSDAHTSKGTLKEVKTAGELNIPVYFTLGELENAFTPGGAGNPTEIIKRFVWENEIRKVYP